VSIDTIRRRIAAGELTAVRLSPRRIGVRASEEERYLKGRQVQPTKQLLPDAREPNNEATT
jgi:hypothetical protein